MRRLVASPSLDTIDAFCAPSGRRPITRSPPAGRSDSPPSVLTSRPAAVRDVDDEQLPPPTPSESSANATYRQIALFPGATQMPLIAAGPLVAPIASRASPRLMP